VRIGEHLLYRVAPEQSVRAVEEFEQAISAMPQSAAAHAGLSIALLQTSSLGVRSLSEVANRAEREAKRALELNSNLATSHYAAALLDLLHHWQLDRSEKSFRRALELDPTSVQSRFGYTQLKFATGEVSEAIRITEEALRLDPASPLLGARYCQAFYYARDFHRAEAECRKVIDREPHYALAHYYLALSLGWLGRTDQARQVFDQTEMGSGVIEVDRAWLSFRDGDRQPALDALQRRRELIKQGKRDPSVKLLLCTMLGRMDEAFEAIEAAVASHAVEMLTLHVDPRLDPLRSDRRYSNVLQRVGLTPRS
jgi:serine/threonine-protein kinase